MIMSVVLNEKAVLMKLYLIHQSFEKNVYHIIMWFLSIKVIHVLFLEM